MSLNRKYLAAMQVEGDVADQILTEHSADMNRVKAELDGYKEKAERYSEAKRELDELKAKAEADDGFKAKYESEKKAFEEFKASTEAKNAEAEKRGLYRKLLNEAGIDAKRVDTVLRVADLSKVTVKDGEIEGKDDLVKAVQEDWKDFIPQTTTEGVNAPNPPQGGGNGQGVTAEQFKKMSLRERNELYQNDRETYDSLVAN